MRVNQPGDRVYAKVACGPNRNLQVADVVQGIVHRMVLHTVGCKTLGRQFNHVISKKLEGKQALPASVNNQWCVFDPAIKNTHSLPGVFSKITYTDIEYRAANQIDSFETGTVEPWNNFFHHCSRHARGPKTLMGVT